MLNPLRVRCLALFVGLVLTISTPLSAASAGSLSAIVRDVDGNPLSDLVVSLVARSAEVLPFLARTDDGGRLLFRNVEAGTYELLVKSSAYYSPAGRLVQIEAGKTLGVRLVLQQILALGSDEENVGLKSLLRTSNERRLIFRTAPGTVPTDETKPFFRNAVFRLDSNTGWGSPGDSSGGVTTNFAVKESLVSGNDYVVAGQLHSGQNSLWRIKNYMDYDLSDRHSIQLVLGYGRLTYGQQSLPLLENPAYISDDRSYQASQAGQRILTLGLSDRWEFGDTLSFLWGVELNQVRRHENQYFANPNASLEYSPFGGSTFRVLLASKRNTVSNTVGLPDGDTVNLADSVHLSSLGDESWIGQARYYQASFTQDFGKPGEVEIAAYRNLLMGGASPFLAYSAMHHSFDAMPLGESAAVNTGYRITLRRGFGENLGASVSFLGGRAPSLDPDATVFVERDALEALFQQRGYRALVAQVDTFIPASSTHLTALVKAVPGGSPVLPVDPMSDVYETSNSGVSLFVRQLVPVPASLLGLFSLDFLSAYTIEALLDIRNITNEELGSIHTSHGEFVLVQHPRTVRGGIAVRF